jgi:hypothetical protein
MTQIIEIYGTVVGVGAGLNSASGIGVEIEEDSTRNLVTVAGLSREQAKAAAQSMGKTVSVCIFQRDAD